ncbi:MAG TPA: hypothetical protein VD962_07900 [Rubricoccaceae bacterium]|nr:hypothetical protein [Rubricoccaceae bacterium]
MPEPTNTAYASPRALLTQWAGAVGAPLVWLAQFEVNYALVPRACAAGSRLPFHLVFFLALVLIAGTGLAAWRTWQVAGKELPENGPGGPLGRSRLLAVVGLASSALFFLLTLAQWLPAFSVDPCVQ